MVINSTNINKTNNHLSPKESLNSDGQLFYQYQQNKQSPLILSELIEHKKKHDIHVWCCNSRLGTDTQMLIAEQY